MRRIIIILLATACFPALAGPELTKSRVLETLKGAQPAIDACGRGLPSSVTVPVRFVIDVEGGVHMVKVEGDHADDHIGRCLTKEVLALRFSHGLRPTPVKYPFHLGGTPAQPAPTTKMSGRLTKKDLDGLLKIIGEDLLRCGDGVAHTEFTIKKTGKVGDVRVRDVDAETGKCVSTKLSRARFPAPAKPTLVQRQFSLDEG